MLFVLGEAERERIDPEQTRQLADRYEKVDDLTLDQLVGVLASADAYLGNDSGPTHLAAAVGTPTVTLFGPTNAVIWAPRGPKVNVLQGARSGEGDWRIKPEAVVDAIKSVVN